MQIYTIDPMLDDRWNDLAANHPRASVFHKRGWLEALARTYGYRPVALTTTPPGERLSDGIAFCEVRSWITGKRLVSLPFSDHSEPLLNESADAFELEEWMRKESHRRNWKYIEIRPLSGQVHSEPDFVATESFWLHTLDLSAPLNQIFCHLHKDCLQRRIRRAEREHFSYERGSSEKLVNDFYRLQMITRRRHMLLPQPLSWFRNLMASMSPNAEIRLVRKHGIPIAAILTLRHHGTVVYKYGCSNAEFHHLAGMPFLFWKLIEESKATGAEQIDFGRSGLEDKGLITFKDRFGATRKRISYLRYPKMASQRELQPPKMPVLRRLFSVLPDAFSSMAGQLVYRHMG